jgi:hypothetical protein
MAGVLTVTVFDQCLDSPNPATANIRISDIDSIHLTVVDKVGYSGITRDSVS